MTNSNGNRRSLWTDERLDRLAVIVESNAENIDTVTQRLGSVTERLDSLTQRLDSVVVAIAGQQQHINDVSNSVISLADTTLQLGQYVNGVSQRVDAVVQRIDNQIMVIAQQQDSINAELERRGRILDYLGRRQNGDKLKHI